MLDTVLRIFSGQALSSRPALERPMTYLKYGLAGAIASGVAITGALATASGGFYIWLTRSGLEQAAALIVVSVFLLFASVLAWKSFSRLMERELAAQEQAAQKRGSTGQYSDLTELLMACATDVAEAFIDGAKTHPGSSANPDTRPQGKDSQQLHH